VASDFGAWYEGNERRLKEARKDEKEKKSEN
jgi:hypothetical protein